VNCTFIHGRTEEEFLENLQRVLQRLREHGITLHPDKAEIGLTQLEYVGHIITQKWMGMSDAKINKVLDFPMPKRANN